MDEEEVKEESSSDEEYTEEKVNFLPIIFIIIIILGLVWTALTYWPSGGGGNYQFTFQIEETGEKLSGTIYFDGLEYALVEEGEYRFSDYSFPGRDFQFIATRSDKDFTFWFEVPGESEEQTEFVFSVPSDNFTVRNEVYEDPEIPDQFGAIKEIHFPQVPITYSLNINTGRGADWYEEERVRWALGWLENETDHYLEFTEVDKFANPMIEIKGTLAANVTEDTFTEGYSAATSILGQKIIEKSIVHYHPLEYDGDALWNYGKCSSYPLIEIHGLIHALGFEHIDDEDNIMYPLTELTIGCRMDATDKKTIECLKTIYSNGLYNGTCENLNIFPNEYVVPNITDGFQDYAWPSLPINVSLSGCPAEMTPKFKETVRLFEAAVDGNDFFNFNATYKSSDVTIHCRDYNEVGGLSLNLETDYWTLTQKPAMHKVFKTSGENLTHVDIYLFEVEDCMNSTSYSLEKIALYRALGLRNDYADELRTLSKPTDCDWGWSFKNVVENKLRGLYPFLHN